MRHLPTLLHVFFFFLVTLFVVVCYQDWQQSSFVYNTGKCYPEIPVQEVPHGAELGKSLFRNNCAACHAADMKTGLTGPALGGMTKRWEGKGGKEALYSWIRDSQRMIEKGENERAMALWNEWKPTVMNSFHNLTDEELDAIVIYVEQVYEGGYNRQYDAMARAD